MATVRIKPPTELIVVSSGSASSAGAQPAISVPASPSVQKGDLIISWTHTGNGSNPDIALSASSAPGYSQICGVRNPSGFDSHETLGVYKIAQGGEEGELIQWKTEFNFPYMAGVIVLRGVDTTNPFDVPVDHNTHHIEVLNDSTIIFPTMSTVTPGTMVFEISSFEDSDNTISEITNTAVGTTTWFQFIDVGGSSNALATYKTITFPQLVGGNTHSYVGADTDADGTAFIFAVRPKNKIIAKPSPELILNGGFDGSSNWTGVNWTISGGVATHTPGFTNKLDQTLTSWRIAGSLYRIKFDVIGRTVGQVRVQIGTGADGPFHNTNGTFIDYLVATTTGTNFSVDPTSDFDGSVDNVSVTKVEAEIK